MAIAYAGVPTLVALLPGDVPRAEGIRVNGVVLRMLGVYGVVAYTAARQQRDIGIRLALGATRTNVRARFVRQALAFAGVGIVIGEIGAAVLMSSLSSQLFGVGPWDPFTYAAVPVLLVALAVVAAWLPARRATTLVPVAVLRLAGMYPPRRPTHSPWLLRSPDQL